ncbi:uncharacterized protein LOC112092599 [Morus notabilis]|uniref:uncharacterized protein LOC112092599 n=1 Tax=Morus notabilis TaxID=981085 RepID=UPI000CED3048|nr:uncharacterized protein LOC112092599 [Morus notabilis]
MKVYVDDMLVKSTRATQHIDHLGKMFGVLRRYHMKLNPLKCAFGVRSGKFLGFLVSNRGIEANPKKIKALQDIRSLTKPKEVQRLTGCVAALNRFISKATDKCVPFFDALKGRVGVLLISPEGHKITSAVRFKFKASNNEAEYEALITGLRLANYLKIERLGIFSDSQLVVGQVKEEYQARGKKMGAYLRKVKEELIKFKSYEILKVPRVENTNADALAKLASSRDSEILGIVPIEELEWPTIEALTI